ncbi:hypothetical protein Aple_035840 [Acrocarpospora pleiomorpha]|uniref:Uncharacterized protein n=1 Tax=Acrocarpospora pleiomorpha TaxID=90975 RepID=A0A5M3XQV1_9ACTN|nr:helix-turn-helix domain-containing protein [Acrocarpospora pleiomorpha]GES20688.1 hypothetical protein Aple_035840 [Acrocarpospora pleiomorpha]
MDTPALLNQVRELRGQGKSPKQIARALGISPSAVTPLIRAVAAERLVGEPELVGCWVNAGWSVGLTVDPARGWVDEAPEEERTAGKASVLVARKQGWDKLTVVGYLVDVYCLGVKNARPPEVEDEMSMREFRERYFSAYPSGYQEVPLDLAQHLVLGAVDYARSLGFEPHEDFAAAAGHLGEWTGPAAITFGQEGKPFYLSGPYDKPRQVIKTLQRTVGDGNYDYILAMPEFDYIA